MNTCSDTISPVKIDCPTPEQAEHMRRAQELRIRGMMRYIETIYRELYRIDMYSYMNRLKEKK